MNTRQTNRPSSETKTVKEVVEAFDKAMEEHTAALDKLAKLIKEM